MFTLRAYVCLSDRCKKTLRRGILKDTLKKKKRKNKEENYFSEWEGARIEMKQ